MDNQKIQKIEDKLTELLIKSLKTDRNEARRRLVEFENRYPHVMSVIDTHKSALVEYFNLVDDLDNANDLLRQEENNN